MAQDTHREALPTWCDIVCTFRKLLRLSQADPYSRLPQMKVNMFHRPHLCTTILLEALENGTPSLVAGTALPEEQ